MQTKYANETCELNWVVSVVLKTEADYIPRDHMTKELIAFNRPRWRAIAITTKLRANRMSGEKMTIFRRRIIDRGSIARVREHLFLFINWEKKKPIIDRCAYPRSIRASPWPRCNVYRGNFPTTQFPRTCPFTKIITRARVLYYLRSYKNEPSCVNPSFDRQIRGVSAENGFEADYFLSPARES